MSSRTFKVQSPHMRGDDVRAWQQELNERFRKWHIKYPLLVDGDYGQHTRAATASFLRAWGAESAAALMEHGVTPQLRTKVRNDRRTALEEQLFHSPERRDYRARLRRRFSRVPVSYPLPPGALITDDWGYHPGVHDGVDLICDEGTPLLAICDATVVRVSDDWWGLGNPGGSLGDRGDGIVIIESLISGGPFSRGLHFGYGHAEQPRVRVGDKVKAGQLIARAGFANAGHTHFMVNDDPPVNGLYRGIGDRDPMPFLDYAKRND